MFLQIDQITSTSLTFASKFKLYALEYTPKIIGAIAVYLIGTIMIKYVTKAVEKALTLKKIDPSLQSFLSSFVKIMMLVLLFLTVFGMLGVNLTSFAAILAGLAVGVGAALNGTLGNFAGGVMMLVFKPFKIGDYIEAQGFSGRVVELGVFNTILQTHENKTIILANGALSTGTIVNLSALETIVVEANVDVNINEDIQKVRDIITSELTNLPQVKSNTINIVVVKIHNASYTLAVKVECLEEKAINVLPIIYETIKKCLQKNNIVFAEKVHS